MRYTGCLTSRYASCNETAAHNLAYPFVIGTTTIRLRDDLGNICFLLRIECVMSREMCVRCYPHLATDSTISANEG